MFVQHLLILAARVLLAATITPTIGAAQHIRVLTRDMTVCKQLGADIEAAAADDDVSWTCTARYGT